MQTFVPLFTHTLSTLLFSDPVSPTMATSTSVVYTQVIEDVINKVKAEFVNKGGPGESVLNELQGLWQMKMMQEGAIYGPIGKNSTAVHDLNIPYGGPEEYEEGREEAERGIFKQALAQDFLTVPPGKREHDDFASQYYNGGFISQRNGAGDATPYSFQLPQLDATVPDPYEDLSKPYMYNYQGVVKEDYSVASTPTPHYHANTPAAVVTQNHVGDDDEDEPLNENDDDDFDDDDHTDDLKNLVLAQFDKVTRTKGRWKCSFKDGIMRINDKDILFNKASGEFDF